MNIPELEIYSRTVCDLVSAVVFVAIIIVVSTVWLS